MVTLGCRTAVNRQVLDKRRLSPSGTEPVIAARHTDTNLKDGGDLEADIDVGLFCVRR